MSQTGFSFNGFIKNLYNNVVLQTDFSDRNSLSFYGCFYIISLPFCIMGIIKSFKEKGVFNFILITAFFCTFALFFIYKDTNINRVNGIYLPLIIFTAIGLSTLLKNKTAFLAVLCTYIIFFCGFNIEYFGNDYRNQISNEFYSSFDEAIIKAEEIADSDDTVYVTKRVNMPYIYVLFYTKPSPVDYHNTVKFENVNTQFQQVESFDKYIFNVSGLNKNQKGIYIVQNNEIKNLDKSSNQVYEYMNYSVVVVK